MRALLLLLLVGGCHPDADHGSDDLATGPADLALPYLGDLAVSYCKVQPSGDAVPMCTQRAPAGSFEPDIQWTWTGPNGEIASAVTPLVANLTDDNHDGAIDLCDTPDVVVVATTANNEGLPNNPGHIYVLDGQTGTQELMIAQAVDGTVTPAIGDLDHDGVPDLVDVDVTGKLWAWKHDGTVIFGPAGQWSSAGVAGGGSGWYSSSLALADLDHDGHVEIMGGNTVWDEQGKVLWTAPGGQASWSATVAADLDGDGLLEVVLGNAAYHHDGTVLWNTTLEPGYPQIADLDGDGKPEVLLTNPNGLSLIENDGTVTYHDLRPTGADPNITDWVRCAAVGDFSGDGHVTYTMSSGAHYTEYSASGGIVWDAPVSDASGVAGGTAFDFLGDGTAEAMYADEQHLWVFDSTGMPIFSMPRTSITLAEYPVVADVDNDGSAEIVVVSNVYGTPSPTVQVIRDKQDRWIQARRIWNQHAYHVTNVNEDGTIPQHEAPSWKGLNTFRTNAQIGAGGVCNPTIL